MKKVKELRGEFSAVLKKAYIQKESVDSVKDKKFTDPTGYEFLESWTWSWIEKQLKAQKKDMVERVEKLVQDKYEESKPMPSGIPKASPSRSHYYERHQGFLSALLVVRDILSSLKK